jgi:hypothetical protein
MKPWDTDGQRLARAVYTATKRETMHAPMLHTVSVGNYLLRSFAIGHMPTPIGGSINAIDLKRSALTVRDAIKSNSRFSGPIPADGGLLAIEPARGGAYFSLDARAQLAELLHYATGSAARLPGDLKFTLNALAGRCLILCKPRNNLDLVTTYEFGAEVDAFYNGVQRHPDVKAALSKSGYGDITQAVFDPEDYSAGRGLSLGLEADPGIDGLAVGSARNYESTGGSGQRFLSGNNVVLFGPNMQSLENRISVLSVYVVDTGITSGTGSPSVTVYEPNKSNGDFEESRIVAL